MNVAFVGAHQDDEMFCLGTLLRYRKRGDRITLICTTNGDKGISDDPAVSYEECARIRDREMLEVARALDADYFCVGAPDEALYDTWEHRLKLVEFLRRSKADVVFTHNPEDYNLDHTTTSTLTFQCAMMAQFGSIRTESPALAAVPKIFYVDVDFGSGAVFEPTHFVELDVETVEEAVRIMGFHDSQLAVSRRLLAKDYRDSIRERLASAGERVGVRFAEGFRPCLASRRTPLARLLP